LSGLSELLELLASSDPPAALALRVPPPPMPAAARLEGAFDPVPAPAELEDERKGRMADDASLIGLRARRVMRRGWGAPR
jgi:hypothetical protein